MVILDTILSLEEVNRNAIYLYQIENRWVAYEQSAYQFAVTFNMGKIEWIGDSISISISNQLEFLYSSAFCLVQIVSVADDQFVFVCKNPNSGFEPWKQKLLR